MILKPIGLTLNDTLEADDTYLPLSVTDNAKLLSYLNNNENSILTLEDNLNKEYIEVTNQCGTVVITKRGIDSEPTRFPKGSCLKFEVSIPVVKWMVCNYDCCSGECDCIAPELNYSSFPAGKVGQPYNGYVTLTGTKPMNFSFTGKPTWMSVIQSGTRLDFTGTPNIATTNTISVSATNCMGQNIKSWQFTIQVAP